MKKVFLLLALTMAMIACGSKNSNAAEGTGNEKDCVEVIYFHGKQRCATCMAIESNTKELIETMYAEELKNGTLVFRSIDISKKENEKIADKYEVTWSSLFVIQHKDGKEKSKNMTDFAFSNARTSPEQFKSGLAETIDSFMKQ